MLVAQREVKKREEAEEKEGIKGPIEIEQMVAENRLKEILGAGEAITKKITELVTTGKLGYYERLKVELPERTYSAQG